MPAKNIPKYPPAKDMKTFPVIAQIIPIIENTIAVPKTKNSNCTNVLIGFSLEYATLSEFTFLFFRLFCY